ncbi:hypothetical protein NQ314_018579 [Rhamnusium bicolor]|uniref:Uncharacterized protein n=1 Tax=Rhamnusium bicolor TaxID=1586634 RepID=A0AAV8WQP3_9CUCU|nr:hypothetical protein NQ314_018579 [Rhamnusium bicolor]
MALGLFLMFTFVVGILCEKSNSKYDNIDLESIIKNERIFKSYVDCLLDKGKCSVDGAVLKSKLLLTTSNVTIRECSC